MYETYKFKTHTRMVFPYHGNTKSHASFIWFNLPQYLGKYE